KPLATKPVCWYRLYFVAIRQRRVDAFAVDELPHLGQDPNALITEEKIDECLAAVGTRGFVAYRQILADAQHFAEPHIIHRRSFLAVGDNISHKTDGDVCFAGRNPFG